MALMSKLQAAYLAGLIDGEGYIGILETKRGNKAEWHSLREFMYSPVMKVAMTNKEIIEWLHNSFGGTFEVRKAHGNARESYAWTCRKASVREFLKHIHPYLKVKRKQAEVIFRFPTLRAGDKVSDSVYEKRKALCNEIRCLNKVGSLRD